MSLHGRRAIGATIVAGLLTALSAGARAQTCPTCHLEQREQRLRTPPQALPESVHGQHGITCTDCHRGNSADPTLHAHDTPDFRPKVVAGTTPAVCGNCHADAQRMADEHSTDPTDQLEQYRGSVHAQAFARGNDRAATCSRCHGAHDIRPVNDPQSPVYPSRVAATCGGCHSDAQLMDSLGMPHDQELQWQNSVHGRAHAAWVESGGPERDAPDARHPPTCNDCHMDHGIEQRERAIQGCARCHLDEWDSFRAGPHEAAFERMGFIPCVDCHGSHEIAAIDPTFIGIDREAACRRCHAEGQEMFETIREMAAEVRDAEILTEDARSTVSGLSEREAQQRLRPLTDAQHALRVAVHTLNPDDIRNAAQAQGEIARQLIAARGAEPEVKPSHAGAWLPSVLVIALGLCTLGLWFYRRRGQP